jgi:hypothetical protein
MEQVRMRVRRAVPMLARLLGLACVGLATSVSAASAGDLLCQSDAVPVGYIATCGDGFGWIIGEDDAGIGPTRINMVVSQDGYYCVARGVSADPNAGDVGYILHKESGLATGELNGANLSQVWMSCFTYDPGPPDPPVGGGPDGPPPS